ncbi:MAG: hypothetical protein ABIG11_06960, partial [bacterium]
MARKELGAIWPGWLFVIMLLFIAAWPIVKWMRSISSDTLNINTDVSDGAPEIKRATAPIRAVPPRFADNIYTLGYRTQKSSHTGESMQKAGMPIIHDDVPGVKPSAQPAGTGGHRTAENTPAASSIKKAGMPDAESEKIRRAFMSPGLDMRTVGSSKGYLTYALGLAINNPAAVRQLFDNPLVVSGFMHRPTVKTVLTDTGA